jgi:hypothetical protein
MGAAAVDAARRSLARTCAVLCMTAVAVGACARPSPEPIEVGVRVNAESGSPIPGAQLRVRGDYLGTTNALGQATLRVPGQAGERLPLSLTCPAGFTAKSDEVTLVLPEPTSPLASTAGLDLVCQPMQHEAVVLVHTAGEALSLPVKVDGVLVGQTDALGFAHVHVRATPESQFEVSLDTSADARLAPANPAQSFRVASSDEVFVFEPAFQPTKARKGKRGAAKRQARSGT